MNWYRTFFILLMSCSAFQMQAQSTLEPYQLEVTLNKTTSLVFPAAITSVDRGSQEIRVQKANGVENILLVKAAVKGFKETNLTVITSDGQLYSFLVHYADLPALLNIRMWEDESNNTIIYTDPLKNEKNLAFYSSKVAESKKHIHGIHDKAGNVSLALNAVFIKDNILFFKLVVDNPSCLNYDVEQFRWYIRDQKASKRTAVQEIEIKPVHTTGDMTAIQGRKRNVWVVALPKFTIPDGKYLKVELMEKNGGRHLRLNIKNRTIIRAGMLSF